MIKVTVKDFAEHRGITIRSVERFIKDGTIPPAMLIKKTDKTYYIDQKKADKHLDKYSMSCKELLADSKVKPDKMIKTAKKAGTAELTFHEARTLAQRYKAALMKLELDEKTEKLIDAEKVKAAAFAESRTVRDALLNIPDRVSPILAAEKDQMKIAEILTREIRAALEELAVC